MNLEKTKLLLDKRLNEDAFDSYGVLVSIDGEKEFLHSENVNCDTYFDIASMGKVLVTSTLILKAIDEKRLSLDDTLQKFFDNVPNEKRNITIKQLLTHSSGIVRYDIPQEPADAGTDAVAEFIIESPPAYAPGTGYTYSCNGMIILGYILEGIYKKTLEEIFNEKIKKPLGYTRSKFNIAIDEPNTAVCYRTENLDGLAHPWDDENIRVLKTSAGSGGQFFPIGSFGHCGHTGASMFFSREKKMYVIILSNATRFLNMKNNFNGYDYRIIEKMREDIHNAIFDDLSEIEFDI